MYDIVLRNGLIVDGTRSVPYIGSVGIIGDRIEDISRDKELVGKEEIDCTGLVISPGFIDLHTHSDACPLNDKSGESMVNQGVTLQIGGNCGISLIPATVENKDEISSFFARTVEIVPDDKNIDLYNMGDYISITNEKNQIINTGLLVGHGTLRAAVMGFDDRKANDEEMEAMKVLLDKELKGGAFGMSLGLIYPPSSYGDVEEFIELGKVIRDNEGIITTHMRDEGDRIFNSIDEMLEVAEKSGVHMHISHLKLMGTPQWGRSQEVLDKIDKAREKGAIITADQYPYEASATGLAALVPSWALSGGNTKMLERLEERSPELLKEIETIMNKRGGPSRVLIASTNGSSPEFDGKYISDISQEMNLDAVETVIQLLLKGKGAIAAVYFSMDMDDILNIMKSMDITIGSDGTDFSYDVSYNPHPRNFGTFPRFLKTVRETGIMTLEDGVYKITELPAMILGLVDRGVLRKGNLADITVFDFNSISDTATYIYSPVKPEGIIHVFLSGKPAILNGIPTENKGGQILLSTN